MKTNNIFIWIYVLLLSAMIAIGRVYDERLDFFGVNFALILSSIYVFVSLFFIGSIRMIKLTKSKALLYLFYFLIIASTPLFWLVYDVIEYGYLKYLNFCLIAILMSVIIIERFDYSKVNKLLISLLAVSLFLAVLAVLGQEISENNDSGRLSVLGGGPIIFSRWMGLGILILSLMPQFRNYKIRYFFIVLFFILSLASGSRGPVLALVLVCCLFLVINFKRYFLRFFVIVSLLVGFVTLTGVSKEVEKLGRVERILMNFSSGGIVKKSTGTRTQLMHGAVTVFKKYPFGVGAGNWQGKANEIEPHNLMPLEYSHNIFLEVLNEYGVFVFIVLILLFIYVFHFSYKLMCKYYDNESSLYTLLFYMLVYLFLNSQISGDINDTRMLFVIVSFILIKTPLIDKTQKLC